MKHKRVWTDEQKAAAKIRMEERWSRRKAEKATLPLEVGPVAVAFPDARKDFKKVEIVRETSPAVQAVLDSMTPERKAKLREMQAKQWAHDAPMDKATREALERHEVLKNGTIKTAAPSVKFTDEVSGHTVPAVKEELVSSKEWNASFNPPTVAPQGLPAKHPFRLTSGRNGLMVSELSDCVCGAKKLLWHPICLTVRVYG